MTSQNTKDIETLKKEVERLRGVMESIIDRFESENYDWYTIALYMANEAAFAIGKEKVRFDTGGYFIPAQNAREIKEFKPHK